MKVASKGGEVSAQGSTLSADLMTAFECFLPSTKGRSGQSGHSSFFCITYASIPEQAAVNSHYVTMFGMYMPASVCAWLLEMKYWIPLTVAHHSRSVQANKHQYAALLPLCLLSLSLSPYLSVSSQHLWP